MRFVGNARFARSRGKTILINAQMNAKRRGSYLSENKGTVLSGFLQEAGFAVRWRLLCPLNRAIKDLFAAPPSSGRNFGTVRQRGDPGDRFSPSPVLKITRSEGALMHAN